MALCTFLGLILPFLGCSGQRLAHENNEYGKRSNALLFYPPRIAIAVLVNSLKGVSSRMLRKEFPEFKKAYWGDAALWSRSYFAASVGGAPLEIVKQYIEQQNTPD